MSSFNVAIVPGHNARSKGAPNKTRRFHEWPLTLYLALMTIEALGETPIEGELFTRPVVDVPEGTPIETAANKDLFALVEDINDSDVDAVLSLHFNAAAGTVGKAHGYALHYPGSSRGAQLAHAVTSYVPAPGGTRVEPRRARELALLAETDVPAVLDEPFFLDDPPSCMEGLRSLSTLAEGYVEALTAYAFGTAPLFPKSTT